MDPDAAALATVGGNGKPSLRMVLVRKVDESGFVFYTNYGSRKADQITENKCGALCYYWKSIGRQVRVEGFIVKAAAEESDAYFAARPRESQLAAWASLQSQELPERAALEARFEEMKNKFKDQDIPRPPHWGGYRLVPELIEFWQMGDFRLHDRAVFKKGTDGVWRMTRLYP